MGALITNKLSGKNKIDNKHKSSDNCIYQIQKVSDYDKTRLRNNAYGFIV